MLMSTIAHAEVFKCMEKFGKAVYQSSPCKPASKEQQLDIQTAPDAAQSAAAKAKLEAIQAEYQTQKNAAEQKQAKQNKDAAAEEAVRANAAPQPAKPEPN
jgi:hypothetical protein